MPVLFRLILVHAVEGNATISITSLTAQLRKAGLSTVSVTIDDYDDGATEAIISDRLDGGDLKIEYSKDNGENWSELCTVDLDEVEHDIDRDIRHFILGGSRELGFADPGDVAVTGIQRFRSRADGNKLIRCHPENIGEVWPGDTVSFIEDSSNSANPEEDVSVRQITINANSRDIIFELEEIPMVPHSSIFYPEVGESTETYENDYSWVGASDLYNGETWLKIGGSPENFRTGVNFADVNIPNGATITSAFMIFYSKYNYPGPTPSEYAMTLHGNDVDNASTPPDANTAENLTLTTASVNWSLDENDPWYKDRQVVTADITTIVQEIVDRGGWASGNNMQILWKATVETEERALYSAEGGYRPQLHIRWET